MDGTRGYCAERNKSITERQLYNLSDRRNLRGRRVAVGVRKEKMKQDGIRRLKKKKMGSGERQTIRDS